jgi:hypothetical protein
LAWGGIVTSDRRLVERTVLPGIMLVLMRSLRDRIPDVGEGLDSCIGQLEVSMREPFDEVPDPKKVRKLSARVARALKQAFDIMVTPDLPISFRAQWLTVAKLIAELSQEDIVLVSEGSPFDLAYQEMLELGIANEDETADAISDTLSAELRKRLEAQGLFVGFRIPAVV